MATLALMVAGAVSTGGAAALVVTKVFHACCEVMDSPFDLKLFNRVFTVGFIAAVRGCDYSHARKERNEADYSN